MDPRFIRSNRQIKKKRGEHKTEMSNYSPGPGEYHIPEDSFFRKQSLNKKLNLNFGSEKPRFESILS